VSDPIIVAILALVGVLFQSWMSNRKTRRMNTAEHDRGAEERQRAHEATLLAISGVQEEVHGVALRLDDHTAMLVDHITDDRRHKLAS
jgi:FtsZ-interacting cell division protein ZipA